VVIVNHLVVDFYVHMTIFPVIQ